MKRRHLQRIVLGIMLLLGIHLVFMASKLLLFQPRLEDGPETTGVDGPLRSDGTIDYAAALNQE